MDRCQSDSAHLSEFSEYGVGTCILYALAVHGGGDEHDVLGGLLERCSSAVFMPGHARANLHSLWRTPLCLVVSGRDFKVP